MNLECREASESLLPMVPHPFVPWSASSAGCACRRLCTLEEKGSPENEGDLVPKGMSSTEGQRRGALSPWEQALTCASGRTAAASHPQGPLGEVSLAPTQGKSQKGQPTPGKQSSNGKASLTTVNSALLTAKPMDS